MGRMLRHPQLMSFHTIIGERPGGRRDPQGPNSSNKAPARLSWLSLAGALSIQPGSLRPGAAATPPVTIPGLFLKPLQPALSLLHIYPALDAALSSSAVVVVVGSEAIADGLKPLTMSRMARLTSQAKIGITPMTAHDAICAEMPNIWVV